MSLSVQVETCCKIQ